MLQAPRPNIALYTRRPTIRHLPRGPQHLAAVEAVVAVAARWQRVMRPRRELREPE